jgi:hypothetical protein
MPQIDKRFCSKTLIDRKVDQPLRSIELAQGCLRCGHVFAVRCEWVAAIELQRFDNFCVRIRQRADRAGDRVIERAPRMYFTQYSRVLAVWERFFTPRRPKTGSLE